MAAVYTTLAEAKAQCRVDFTDDDIYIAGLQEMVEQLVLYEIQGSVPGEGTVTTNGTTALVGADTNFTDYIVGDTINVAGETVRTIATITDDTHLTVGSAFSTSAAELTYVMHPGFPDPLPLTLKHAMLLMIAHFYTIREPVVLGVGSQKIEYSFDRLIGYDKHWTVA